jgi:hypothetical protein
VDVEKLVCLRVLQTAFMESGQPVPQFSICYVDMWTEIASEMNTCSNLF